MKRDFVADPILICSSSKRSSCSTRAGSNEARNIKLFGNCVGCFLICLSVCLVFFLGGK